jgi:hypothetical protein
MENKWQLVWGSWGLAFVAAETIALASGNPEAPLSHHLRRVLGVRKTTVHHRLGQVSFATGALWLTYHLWREAVASVGN